MIELFALTDDTFQRMLIAAALGALIGLERELAGKDPSLRTFMLISLGSCMFSMSSLYAAAGVTMADPGRISAQIVTGVGFLGAGAIFRSQRGISGLTTAALMWVTAAIGMLVGFDRTDMAVQGTAVGLIVMLILNIAHRLIRRFRPGFYESEDY